MANIINLENKRFGKLLVLKLAQAKHQVTFWECICDCGRKKIVASSALRKGLVKTCGQSGCKQTTFVDITNQIFGRLTAQSFFFHKNLRYWNCTCVCGNTKAVPASKLLNGSTKSCGCLQRDCGIEAKERRTLKPGVSAKNATIKEYKKRAKQYNREFTLSDKETETLMSNPCHYCGIEPQNKRVCATGIFVYSGIDRKDNGGGYTRDNVVSCCRECNFAKGSRDYIEFLTWIRRVIQHHFKRKLEQF